MIKLNKIIFLSLFVSSLLLGSKSMADDKRDKIQMTLKDGVVLIETRPDVAPKHVDQIKKLISEGQYDGVVFHRVIEGFMAQTGDVEFGNSSNDKFNLSRAGTGGSFYLIYRLNFLMLIMVVEHYQWHEQRLRIVQIVNSLFVLMIVHF